MFLNILPNPALNVSYVLLNILEISYSKKATMRRKVEALVKTICETDAACSLFAVQLKLLSQKQILKFTFETQAVYINTL